MATYELVYERRMVREGPDAERIDKPGKAVRYFLDNCFTEGEMWREKAVALFLDERKTPLGHFLVGVGDDTAVRISNKFVVKAALDSLSCGVILCHNHPSGDPKPGPGDNHATDSLRRALGCLDIALIDHIVLGEKGYFSFHEEVECQYPRKRAR